MQEDLVCFALYRDAADTVAGGVKIVVAITLRLGAQQVQVDPEYSVKHDLQLARQFGPLGLRRLNREVA